MQYQFSMNESVESVTRKLVALCKTQKAPESRAQMFRLFQLLCSMKFDFYLILSILCNLNEFSTSELKIILQASPSPDQILQPTPQNIRITIPRWTPSKYHSGRIADIVTDVYEKIDRALPGIYIYICKSTRYFPTCSHNFPKAGEARFQGRSRLFRLLGKFPYLGESRRILMAVSSKTSSKTRFYYAATRRISSAAVQPSIWA